MRNDLVERGILSIEWSCCNPVSRATKLAKFAKETEDHESEEFGPRFLAPETRFLAPEICQLPQLTSLLEVGERKK